MPLRYPLSERKENHFGLLLVVSALVLYGFFSMSIVSSEDTIISADSLSSIRLNASVQLVDYKTFVTDPSLPTKNIILNGAVKNMVNLPDKSVVVMLPDDRLAIKSKNETSILPEGSTLSYFEDKPIVSVPQQSKVISVSSVIVSPLEDFAVNTHFIQRVQELDVYEVQVVFFELVRESPEVPLVTYNIDWGDGGNDTYAADTVAVAHTYDKSGMYLLRINASDALGFTYLTTKSYTVNYEGLLAHSSLWVTKNKGPMMTLSLGFGLFAVGFLAFTESGKYKFLVLWTLLLPMYSRIQKEDVLDQFVRGQIYGYIKTNPGVHYNQILRKVGVKNGTLSYHLGVLEKTELIQSRREGLKYRVFYPTGMNFPKAERFRLTNLQILMLDCVKNQPGMTQKEIARVLGKKPQTINYNIKVLDQAGLISVVKHGRKTTCYPVVNSSVSSE